MGALGDRALKTRVERIAREQSKQFSLAFETSIVGIEVAESLEAGDTTNRLGGAASIHLLL